MSGDNSYDGFIVAPGEECVSDIDAFFRVPTLKLDEMVHIVTFVHAFFIYIKIGSATNGYLEAVFMFELPHFILEIEKYGAPAWNEKR